MADRDAAAVAIVAGASGGTGCEAARRLARGGCAIVVVYLDDQSGAETTVAEIFAAEGTAVAVRADVADGLDVERLFDETVAAFGRVDAVVHTPEETTPALVRQLRQRNITTFVFPKGPDPAGVDHGLAELISFLRRQRHTR